MRNETYMNEEMKAKVVRLLRDVEERENVRVLLAVESGSRAWGFASPDSDYDVRFLYVRREEDYLRLTPVRDVVELPLDGVLDVNGWDVKKALTLLGKSNPTLFEWFSSPLVYMKTEEAELFQSVMNDYFSRKRTLWHYLSMAEHNYREYLKADVVPAKKYFYVLRPVLACRWVMDYGTPPPMLFSELMESEMDKALVPEVRKLLDVKMNTPEVKKVPRVDALNRYLEESMAEMKDRVSSLPKAEAPDWERLDQLFLTLVKGSEKGVS